MTPNKIPLYQALARALSWQQQTNEHFAAQAAERVRLLVDMLPHGSGIDGTNTAEWNAKTGVLSIDIEFHHMNEVGTYDGWTSHTIRVKPSLLYDVDLTVSGPDRNDVKDYLGEIFDHALRELVPEHPEAVTA